jgi:tetratricopeptide (TPR) repeat protein
MLKRYDQAYKAALDAEKYYEKCTSVYSTKAGILEQMGRYAEAAEAFRQSDRCHASDWVRHQTINCLIKAGKPEEALKETARLMAMVPNDPDALRLRSSIYKQLKNYPAALKRNLRLCNPPKTRPKASTSKALAEYCQSLIGVYN